MTAERRLLTLRQIDDIARQMREHREDIDTWKRNKPNPNERPLPTCPACEQPAQHLFMSEYEDGTAHIDFEDCGHLFRVEGEPPIRQKQGPWGPEFSTQSWIDYIHGDR